MMDNRELMIDPIKIYGSGSCPVCFTSLIVGDSEINIIDLDMNGIATNIETSVHCRAICPKCKYEQEMMRLDGRYVPYSQSLVLFNSLEIKNEIDRRKNEGKYSIKSNPLSL